MVDIGQREFALGLTYVALARVKTLEGLLLNPISYDRISRLKGFEFMTYRVACKNKLLQMK